MRDRGAAWGTVAALTLGLTLVSCGHPEKKVVDQYFGAVNQKDNQTLSSFAAVGFDQKVDNWTISNVSPERRQPAPLPELVKKRKDAEAAVNENNKTAKAYQLDHLEEVNQIREIRKKNQPVPAKLQALAAEWDKFNQQDRDLKKVLAEAKDAVEKEKRDVALSVGQLEDVESLSGEMVSKDYDLVLTLGGQPKNYVMTLRKYELSSGEKVPKVMNRWIVHNLTPKG
jgi:septal ring factor EnvC (AmiA/AmiB activator)